MKYDSFVPQHYKHNLVFGLLNRAWKICSSYELFCNELQVIKQLLMCNGFPVRFVNKTVKVFLNKKNNLDVKCDATVQTCAKRTVFMGLPFCGKNSVKLSRQLHNLLAKVAPWAKLNLMFKPVLRLKSLSKLKSSVPVLNQSNIVYKVNCTDCNDFYIGLTTRRLHKRLKEHQKRKYCAIYKHVETGHKMDLVNPQIIGNDNIKIRLQVKETLQISHHAANKSLNVNIDSFECKLW
jgi:predicted GIY-YIG superfamily endonuclease